MECFHCHNSIEDNSWLHLTNISTFNEDKEKILIEKHICGYSCYKRLRESNSLPKELWFHIVNKHDYDGLIRPVIRKEKETFEYLARNEIQQLNDVDQSIYYSKKAEQIHMNPITEMIHDEIDEEDERTAYLELISSDDELINEYYE